MLRRVVAVQSSDADVVSNRAAALLGLGRLEEALAGRDQTILLAPNHVGAIANRGLVLMELERPEEALACFDHALQANPEPRQCSARPYDA